jgi:hypothetical protein
VLTSLAAVLYGCGNSSFTLKKEHRLRIFDNKVLRKIFGSMKDEVTGQWRKLHKEELYDLHFSPNIIPAIKSRRMKWQGRVPCMGSRRDAYRILIGDLGEKYRLEYLGLGRKIILK